MSNTILSMTAIDAITWKMVVMWAIVGLMFYMAINHKFEPMLMIPIAFGALLANLPTQGILNGPEAGHPGGLFYYISKGVEWGIYPPIIFMGVGAITDFGPLIANPRTLLLGGAAQVGVLVTFLGCYVSGIFSDFTFIIYNGDGIRVKCTSRSIQPFAKELSVNNYGQLINKYFQLPDNVHLFVNYSISEVLQILKNDIHHSHNFISIISGHLASRGISFVSSDYSLHLTDQYFHPGKKSHGENLLQSLRILGCYKVNKNITLWCNKQTWKDILEQNKIINTLVESCDDNKEWFKYIQEVIISKPSRPTTRSILSFKYDHVKDTKFKLNLEEEI